MVNYLIIIISINLFPGLPPLEALKIDASINETGLTPDSKDALPSPSSQPMFADDSDAAKPRVMISPNTAPVLEATEMPLNAHNGTHIVRLTVD
jgi:hypothetical protein